MSGSSADETVLRATLDTSGFSAGELKILVSINNINQAVDNAGQKFAQHEARMSSLQTAAQALAGAMAVLTAGFTVDKLIEVNTEYDKLNTELITVTGSAKGAQVAMQSLINFANTSPYTLSQVTDAFIELRNAGLNASTGMLGDLSNVASSLGQPIGRITQALAGAAVGNTEMLRSFGIEAQAAGDKFIVSFQGVTQMINRTGPALEAYVAKLGATVFEGDTARQAQTISGLMSTMEDSVQNVLRAVGDGGFNDAFRGLIADVTTANNGLVGMAHDVGGLLGDAINEGRNLWKEYGSEITTVVTGLGGVVAAGTAMGGIATVIELITAAINPWSVAIAATVTELVSVSNKTIEIGGQKETVLQVVADAWGTITDKINAATTAANNYFGVGSKGSTGGSSGYMDGGGFSLNPATLGYNLGYWIRSNAVQQSITTFDAGTAYDHLSPVAPVSTTALPRSQFGNLPQSDLTLSPGLLSQSALQHPDLIAMAQQVAQQQGVPVNYFLNLIDRESNGFDVNARNKITGASGLGQILPSTAANPGYGLSPLQGDINDPLTNLTFAAKYLKARAPVGADGKTDWLAAAGVYGTTSLAGNLGNLSAADAASAKVLAGLRMDNGYQTAQDTRVGASAQGVQAVSQLGIQAGLASYTGAGSGQEKATAQQLINAGYAVSVDPSNPYGAIRAMTQQEAEAKDASGQYRGSYLATYRNIASLAPVAYNSQITQQQKGVLNSIAGENQLAGSVSQGKDAEIAAQGQEKYNAALLAGESYNQADTDRTLAKAKAYADLNLQVAQAIQQQNLQTTQMRALTGSISGQGIVFDRNTNTYVMDTRSTDALRIQQQIDPYNRNPMQARATATASANATWDQNQANEVNQRRLTQISNADPIAGLRTGWQSYYDDASNINKQVATAFTDSMSSMNDALVSFVKTGKMSWTSLADTVITDLTTMALKSAETGLFNATGVTSFFSSLGGSGLSGSTGAVGTGLMSSGLGLTNAIGGIYGSGLGSYSNTIVNTPTYFNGSGSGRHYATGTADLMGEAGPEAIIPLKRAADGSLGVRMSGGAGGGTSVSTGDIVIHNPQVDGGGNMTKAQAAALQKQIRDEVNAGVMKTLAGQQRPGGALYGTGRR